MALLGNTTDVTPQMEENATEFVSGLYSKNVTVDLNMLRYNLFIQPGKEKLLPLTADALHHHVLRCNYEAYLWKHALDTADVPAPEGNGWGIQDGRLVIHYSTEQPAQLPHWLLLNWYDVLQDIMF